MAATHCLLLPKYTSLYLCVSEQALGWFPLDLGLAVEDKLLNFLVFVHAEQKYSCEVRIITVDFSDGMEIYPNLAEQLKDLDIGVLSKPDIPAQLL